MKPSDTILEPAFLDDACIENGWRAADHVAARAVEIEKAAESPAVALAAMVRHFGAEGLLNTVAATTTISWRTVCLIRERLGFASPLADLAFAMQGLGSYPITLAGTPEQHEMFLPPIAEGREVAGFALTERDAGSDLAGIRTTATRDGESYVLMGEKVLISNAPIADVFTVFAATQAPGYSRRLSAFVVPGDVERLTRVATPVLGGHPIGELHFDGVRVPVDHRLGNEGDGMRIALGTLHRFRPTVGAAALGFAQRALDETVRHVKSREQFGAPLGELQAVQLSIADMVCELEAARLLVYRAAAISDADAGRELEARTGSIAKLSATEAAGRIIDRAVQLHGGRGVMTENIVARLYEDVRSLRIYEGASDIQRILIARQLLADE